MRNIGLFIGSLGKGGAERVMSILANSLSVDANVTMYLMSERESVYELDTSVKVVYLRKEGLFNEFIYILKSLKNIDIAIAFTTKINVLVLLSSLLRIKRRIIVSERTARTNKNVPYIWRRLRLLYWFSDCLVLPSEADVSYFNRFVRNICVIPNGNNMRWKSLENRSNVILMVGRLERVKNHIDILKIVTQNKKKFLDKFWRVIIYGEGSLSSEISCYIESNSLENIVAVKPFVTDVQSVYHDSKIFVLPSLNEGYPNTLCEALVSGCACLSYDIETGPAEIINHEENGILIEAGRSDLMESSLLDLMNSNKLLYHYNNGARKVSENFTTKKMLEAWKELVIK